MCDALEELQRVRRTIGIYEVRVLSVFPETRGQKRKTQIQSWLLSFIVGL